MSTVRDILAIKGMDVLTIRSETTVLDAAALMNERKIGSLVVVDEGRLIGMFTERDILTRVVVTRRDPAETLVGEVMTTEVACCRPYTHLDEVRGTLKNRRIRHLPVVDDANRLCGMISIGDLNAFQSHSQEVTIHLMEEYIHGRV